MQRIHPVLLLVLLGIQCKQKSVELVIPACFPTTISTTVTGSTTNFTYNYNSSNQVTSTNSTSGSGTLTTTVNVVYTYDGDGNISTAAETSNAGYSATRNYTYNMNHNLTQDSKVVNGKPESTATYHYNATLQLTAAEITSFSGSSSFTNQFTYTYATPVARNPTSMTLSSGPTWTFQYDTKPNPLKVLFVSLQPDNNLTKITMTSGGTSTTTTYTYQYDGNGFPVARTGSDGETKTYAYSCK